MVTSRFARLSLVALVFLMVSCRNQESPPIPTKEMLPQFEVRTDENGVSKISAVLVRDFFSPIELVGGDQISVTGGSAKLVARSASMLQTGNAAGTAFQFDFQRPSQVQAPDSRGTLPAPMTLTAPAANTTYSAQNDSITVRWSGIATTDAMSAQIDVTCRTFTGGKPIDQSVTSNIDVDIGIATVSLSDLASRLANNCSVYDGVFTLRRSRDGTLDSAYGPSDDCKSSKNCFVPDYYLVIRQVRAVPIVINNKPA